MFDFGIRLRELREARHMSQEELGKKINKSKSVISSFENNLKIPSVSILTSLAVLYNVSLDYLVGIEHKKSLILDGLSEHQTNLIYTILLEFRDEKAKKYRGLTARQIDILSSLMVEFSAVSED